MRRSCETARAGGCSPLRLPPAPRGNAGQLGVAEPSEHHYSLIKTAQAQIEREASSFCACCVHAGHENDASCELATRQSFWTWTFSSAALLCSISAGHKNEACYCRAEILDGD